MTHNRIGYLKEAIASIFNSTTDNYQLVIFNDCSTDGTNEYLDTLKKEKQVIEIRHEKNLGQYKNSNYIFDNIDCKYFLILHDDDLIEPDLIEKKINLMESDDDIVMVGSGWKTINENGVKLKEKVFPKFTKPVVLTDREYFLNHFDGLTFPWSGTLFRKEKIKDFRFSDYDTMDDAIFMIEIVPRNKVGYIPDILSSYRKHKSNISLVRLNLETNYKMWIKIFNFYYDVIRKNFNEPIYLKKFNIAKNKTMFYLLISSPNFAFFFKILKSKYLILYILKPVQWLRIIYKFLKLLFRVNKPLKEL